MFCYTCLLYTSYPELSCDSTQTYKVSPTWGEFEQVFCPSETTFKFFEGVMDEVIELFSSEYIHIGGDECPKTAWKNSAFCLSLIHICEPSGSENFALSFRLGEAYLNLAEAAAHNNEIGRASCRERV